MNDGIVALALGKIAANVVVKRSGSHDDIGEIGSSRSQGLTVELEIHLAFEQIELEMREMHWSNNKLLRRACENGVGRAGHR